VHKESISIAVRNSGLDHHGSFYNHDQKKLSNQMARHRGCDSTFDSCDVTPEEINGWNFDQFASDDPRVCRANLSEGSRHFLSKSRFRIRAKKRQALELTYPIPQVFQADRCGRITLSP
jgi:hypothetical protein